MRPGIREGSALAAEPPASRHRNHAHRVIRLRRAGPHQGNHPADHRPSQKQVQQNDPRSVSFISSNDRWQEVQQNQGKQGQHRAPLSLQRRRSRHPRAPLSLIRSAAQKCFVDRLLVYRRLPGQPMVGRAGLKPSSTCKTKSVPRFTLRRPAL